MNQEYQKLNYEIYDRQMSIFCNALELFIEGYKEYSSTELSMDIHSLCIKASRLCYMADQDYAIQQETLFCDRTQQNISHLESLSQIISNGFSQMMESVIDNIKNKKTFDGVKLPRIEGEFADILPNISGFIFNNTNNIQLDVLHKFVRECQNIIEKEKKAAKKHGEKSIVRFWNLTNLYAYTCYLYYHFRRLDGQKLENLDEEQLKRLFILCINNYRDSDEGRRSIETFIGLLNLESNGIPLTKTRLREIGKELVNDIPYDLKLCYMDHRDEPDSIVAEILKLKPKPNELRLLADALIKWAIIKSYIDKIDNPRKYISNNNDVIRCEINGVLVDFVRLKSKIKKMAGLINAKNQWFCLWCVLKHQNLLADTHFEAFATEMMSAEWFPNTVYPFTGDNLSDYSNYFGEIDFKRWNFDEFQTYRATHKKSIKKWSDSLFVKFSRLCYEINTIYEEETE